VGRAHVPGVAGAAEVKVEQVFNLLVPVSQSPAKPSPSLRVFRLAVSPSSSTTSSKSKTEREVEWLQRLAFSCLSFAHALILPVGKPASTSEASVKWLHPDVVS
jgi:hypothetical protein